MNSGLHVLDERQLADRFARRRSMTRTRLPARSPPACRLVCPSIVITVPSENAPLKPGVERHAEAVAVGEQDDDRDNAPRDAEHRQRGPEPVVIQADERLHDDVAEDAASLHLEPQGVDRRQFRGAPRGIGRRDDADDDQRQQAPAAPTCQDRIIPAKRCGIGARFTSQHRPSATSMPAPPLSSVRKKPSMKNCCWMLRVVAPSALRTPISRVRSLHRHQHDVHHADAAERQRDERRRW